MIEKNICIRVAIIKCNTVEWNSDKYNHIDKTLTKIHSEINKESLATVFDVFLEYFKSNFGVNSEKPVYY